MGRGVRHRGEILQGRGVLGTEGKSCVGHWNPSRLVAGERPSSFCRWLMASTESPAAAGSQKPGARRGQLVSQEPVGPRGLPSILQAWPSYRLLV